MAVVNSEKVKFEELRLIICINGFHVDDKYEVAELGFWSRKFSGKIPFITSKCYKNLKLFDRISNSYMSESVHGIDFNHEFPESLNQTDLPGAIKTIVSLCGESFESIFTERNKKCRYIGYSDDFFAFNILAELGYGDRLVDINKMFKGSHGYLTSCIVKDEKYKKYRVCPMHSEVDSGDPPICAKAKAKFLAQYCLEKSRKLK